MRNGSEAEMTISRRKTAGWEPDKTLSLRVYNCISIYIYIHTHTLKTLQCTRPCSGNGAQPDPQKRNAVHHL